MDRFPFDGGYFSFDSNGKLNGCHLYVQDYQGNNRMVVNASNDSIEQITHYYPYGGVVGNLSTNPDTQEFKYGGKELDRFAGIDLYDFQARQLDSKLGCFTSIDPMAEKYYGISPYAYCAGDPVNCIDPTGESTKVVYDSTGYHVIGGDINDHDRNIYLITKDQYGEECNTGIILGRTPTMTSFYDSDHDKWEGTISLSDNSGIDFLTEMYDNTPGLFDYMGNAGNGEPYDFKDTNGTDHSTVPEKNQKNPTPYYYRGMPIGYSYKDGVPIYTSAREIGNMGAGIVARRRLYFFGIARLGFDAYQTYSSGHLETEGISTQNAEKYGFKVTILTNKNIKR